MLCLFLRNGEKRDIVSKVNKLEFGEGVNMYG